MTDRQSVASSGMHDAAAAKSGLLPRQPKTVPETGIDQHMVVELVAKTMHIEGRHGDKIHVGPLSEANYAVLFRHQCHSARVACDEVALRYLLLELHGASCMARVGGRCWPVILLSWSVASPTLPVQPACRRA